MTQQAKAKKSRSRDRLGKLLREGGELLTIERAARILGLSNVETAKTLARWSSQGWLARVKRGLYVAVPIEAASADRAWRMPGSWSRNSSVPRTSGAGRRRNTGI